MAHLRAQVEADPLPFKPRTTTRYARRALFMLAETHQTHVHVQLRADGSLELDVYRGDARTHHISLVADAAAAV